MRNIIKRLEVLERRQSTAEYTLLTRKGETEDDAVKRYAAEGRQLAPYVVVSPELMNVDEWTKEHAPK
jgi:hypothetical protein